MESARPSKHNDIEKNSAYEYKILIGKILRMLATRFGGEATLNQMRIGHYVGEKSLYDGRPTNNSDISRALNIPRSTVSRIVTDCIEKGWFLERPHPEDGRKKMLIIPDTHPEKDAFEHDFQKLMVAFLEKYDAGEIVKIKKGASD